MKALLPPQTRARDFFATAKCGTEPYSADCTEDSSLCSNEGEWSWMEVSRDLGKRLINWENLNWNFHLALLRGWKIPLLEETCRSDHLPRSNLLHKTTNEKLPEIMVMVMIWTSKGTARAGRLNCFARVEGRRDIGGLIVVQSFFHASKQDRLVAIWDCPSDIHTLCFFSVMHLRNDMCWQHGQKGWGGGATFHVSDKNRKDEKCEDKLACAGYHLASVWESAKACVEAVSISFCSTLSCQPGVLVSMPFDDCLTVGQLFALFVRSDSPFNIW